MITHSFSHLIVNFRGWIITHIFLASVGLAPTSIVQVGTVLHCYIGGSQQILSCLPMLLMGWAWAIYESLGNKQMHTYQHLKTVFPLCPDTEEDRMISIEKIMKKQLWENESIDELARDIETLLNRAHSGLRRLWFYLSTRFLKRVAFS